MFKKQELKQIKELEEAWQRENLTKTLARFPERKKTFTTDSGISLERVYTPRNIEGLDYSRDSGFPGEFPFTRGIYSTMYRGRFWTMRQYAGFGTAEQTNKRFKYLLRQGQTGLSVAFDFPTQICYDCDHALSKGEVGKTGVSVSSLK